MQWSLEGSIPIIFFFFNPIFILFFKKASAIFITNYVTSMINATFKTSRYLLKNEYKANIRLDPHGGLLPWMLWTVNTFYTTLSRNDWSNGKKSRTKVVVLAVVGTPVPPPPMLVLLLWLLKPWKQPLHRLKSSLFHHTHPPALCPLTNLMYSN
jgi:hypothetical protein